MIELKDVEGVMRSYPSWFTGAARIARVKIDDSEMAKSVVASFQHGSRELIVYKHTPMNLLTKAIGHELAHGIDDWEGRPHYFSSHPAWKRIHAKAAHFDIPKYREEALEYFADMVVKTFLIGEARLSITNPDEVNFISTFVFPTIRRIPK